MLENLPIGIPRGPVRRVQTFGARCAARVLGALSYAPPQPAHNSGSERSARWDDPLMPTPPPKKYLRSLLEACDRLRETGDPALAGKGLAAAAPPSRPHRTPPSPALMAEILRRDGFCCRYCGAKVVPAAVLRAAALAFPDSFGADQKGHPLHPLFASNAATVDVVDSTKPMPADGPGTEDEVVTACPGCAAQKGELTLKRLGWELGHPRDAGGWDGLVGSYESLLLHRRDRVLPASDRNFHVRWLRAFDLDVDVLKRWQPVAAAA